MSKPTLENSPQILARIAGLLYLGVIVAGIIAEMFISGRLIAPADAAATAVNVLANRPLFQLGLTVYLIEMALQIAMTVPFYVLLKPVSRSGALLMVFFNLVGCAIKIGSRAFYITPLLVLEDTRLLSAFTADQVQALAMILFKVNEQAAGVSLVWFGFGTLAKGYLIIRSTFLPRLLGVCTMLAALGWLSFLYPPLASALFPTVLAIGLLVGLLQILWLLLKGVDVERWNQRRQESA